MKVETLIECVATSNAPSGVMSWLTCAVLMTSCFLSTCATSPKYRSEDTELFLTPLIENGQIEEAQKLATVLPMMENIHSFSGYLTINKTCNANLFFWLFRRQRGNWKKRPLVLWLDADPGNPTLPFVVFRQVGPFSVDENFHFKRRVHSLTRDYNVMFIDNTVGTGLSFTEDDACYPDSRVEVADGLYTALVQLHTLFPSLQNNRFFVVGSSASGKYPPELARKILDRGPTSTIRVNLSGIIILAGVLSYSMVTSASGLWNLGLYDNNQLTRSLERQARIVANGRAHELSAVWEGWLDERSFLTSVTGFKRASDFMRDDFGRSPNSTEEKFYNHPETRKALHAGHRAFSNGKTIGFHMRPEMGESAIPTFEGLLPTDIDILFLTGQQDMSFPYIVFEELFTSLKWPGAADFNGAKRCQFRINDRVAGYYRTVRRFTEVLIRGAGHIIYGTQPKTTYRVIDEFIRNTKNFQCT